MVDKKPKNSSNVTPYLMVKNADEAIKFYEYVLGGKLDFRMDAPDGKVMHASLRIGDSQIMVTEYREEWAKGRKGYEQTQACTYIYLDDPDAAFKRAREKGALAVMEPADMFYGDRTAAFQDPFGQNWTVAVHVEDVSEDEMKRRGKEMFSKAA